MAAGTRIAGVMIAGVALCACATTKPPAATAQINDPSCLKDTGSRVSPGPGECRGIGRSYSSQDIQRTGQTSAAGALSLLDSSVTVRR
jgi:hypothetical protein